MLIAHHNTTWIQIPSFCPVQVVSVAWTSKLGGWVLRALPRTGSRLWKEHISLIGYERNISTLTRSLSLPELLYFDRKKQNQRNIIYHSNETLISLPLQKWLEKSRLGSHFKLKQVWYCWGRYCQIAFFPFCRDGVHGSRAPSKN